MNHRAPAGPPVPVARGSRTRTAAQVLAVLAGVWAVADLCRWGNRWYVATRWIDAPGASQQGYLLLQSAHACLVSALVALAVAGSAAVVGWRLRVTGTRG